jgi:GTP cyclohydrolase I
MRNKSDFDLGVRVRDHLTSLGLETVKDTPKKGAARDALEKGIAVFFDRMGLDLGDESIAESPLRIAQMFADELCAGLDYANEMVMLKDITTISLCEHHFQTIAGRTHIAYIPGETLLGVSKLARITNFFMRRPQVQERLTAQIFYALQFILGTEDVAVQQESAHYCIRARGVMDPNSMMVTSKMGGRFMTNPSLRQEYLHAIR